jgi:hypothetical protein
MALLEQAIGGLHGRGGRLEGVAQVGQAWMTATWVTASKRDRDEGDPEIRERLEAATEPSSGGGRPSR